MKTLDLKSYEVQEMNVEEMEKNEGGTFLQTLKNLVNNYCLPSIIRWN